MKKMANKLTRNYTLCPPEYWATSTDPARAKREWLAVIGKASMKYTPSLTDYYFRKAGKCAKGGKKSAKSATPATGGVCAKSGKKSAKVPTKGGSKKPAVVGRG